MTVSQIAAALAGVLVAAAFAIIAALLLPFSVVYYLVHPVKEW